MALDAAGLDKASALHRPRLLSDNGSSYISDDLAKWLKCVARKCFERARHT